MSFDGETMRTSRTGLKNKAQAILEYAILIAVISAAVGIMALYVRRAVQGKLNTIEDQIAPKANGVAGSYTGAPVY